MRAVAEPGIGVQRTARPTRFGDDCVILGRLLTVPRDPWSRSARFQLRADFLDLRGLLFYCCRETRNGVFQFRDSLLLFLEFTARSLRLCRLWTAPPELFSRSIDKVRA